VVGQVYGSSSTFGFAASYIIRTKSAHLERVVADLLA